MEFLRRIAAWWHARRNAADLQHELEAHRAFAQDELERAGLAPADAAAASRRRMGNVLLAREDSRDVWIVRWMDRTRQDVRHGLRALRREPLFAATAIVTLALGIATTTTIFSVVDSELWRPLPYADPDRLIVAYSRPAEGKGAVDGQTVAEFLEWREGLPGLEQVAAFGGSSRGVLRLAHAESVRLGEVTANYFTTLGRTAIAGRVFDQRDARGSDAIVLNEEIWERLFARDPSVVGRQLLIDDRARTVVGVVSDDQSFGQSSEIVMPIDERPGSGGTGSTSRIYGSIGRLAPDSTMATVQAQAAAVLARRDAKWAHHAAMTDTLRNYYGRLDNRQLYFFLIASLFVLALAIINTTGLVLSRTLRRGPEFALRGALGGGGWAIAAQSAAEAGLLVVPAVALGLYLSAQAVGLVDQVVPPDFLQNGTRIALDLRGATVAVVAALIALAGLVIVPLRLARRAGRASIGSGARSGETPAVGRARGVLLISQVALTVVLLAGAGVFVKSFGKLLDAPLGFRPETAWAARITLSGPRYADDDRRRIFADSFTERARAIPGIELAAVATSSPLMSGWLSYVSDAAAPQAGPGDPPVGERSIYRAVGADYFDAIGTPILEGRGFLPSDTPAAPDVAIVNQRLAGRLFPGRSAVGQSVMLSPQHAPVRPGRVVIVGVAGNIKEISVNEVDFPDVYVPFAQRPASQVELIVRGRANDAGIAAALRDAAAAIEPAIPVTSVTSLSRRVYNSLAGARFNLTLVAGFAASAVLIAAIGIYGAMAFAVSARWREFGVRLALGSTPRALAGRALWSATRIGLAGGGIGLVLALIGAYWLGDALYLVPGQHNGLLFETRTTDPVALAAAALSVTLLALLAGTIPALRVRKVDPTTALRAE